MRPFVASAAASVVRRFVRLREHLVGVMATCGDQTLLTTNQNVLQTISQVIELESDEVRKEVSALLSDALGSGDSGSIDSIPRGFLCPITLALIEDPVIAADGHSYSRAAITTWLHDHDTSPVTNLRLPVRFYC